MIAMSGLVPAIGGRQGGDATLYYKDDRDVTAESPGRTVLPPIEMSPMRRVRIGIASLFFSILAGCLHASVLWSPDGEWLAYTMASRPDSPGILPGWLFDPSPEEPDEFATSRPRSAAPLVYRLWATRADGGESVLLEESRGPLTSPCWSPDGRLLAFGRLVHEEEGRARFEILVQEAPDRKRIIFSRPLDEFNSRAAGLPGLALAWSPDGRYLAIPLFQQTLTLGIIRADNGRVLKEIKDAYLPSWSPDGTKLAFVQGSEAETLQVIDQNFGPPRHLADIGQSSQAPAWARDSRSLAIVARRTSTTPRREVLPSHQTELLRVHVESRKRDVITGLHSEPGDRDAAYRGTSFAIDREGDELFHVSDVEGKPNVIVRFHPRTRETLETFHPIDHAIRIGALAVSPGGKSLAFRVGPPGDFSTPAIVELDANRRRVTPLVPDDAARIEWVSTLIHNACDLLRANLPASDAQDKPIVRPNLLPVPGELPANSEIATRLRRLGRIGRPLCQRPEDAPPAGPALLDTLAEARLFFDYLGGDYKAALAALDDLEPRLNSSEQRLRLLGVRAQIFLGLMQTEQAGKTIAFLRKVAAKPGLRYEQTPIGAGLIVDAVAPRDWADYLSERNGELVKTVRAAGNESPLGNRNPDNPDPDADLLRGPGLGPGFGLGGGRIPFGPFPEFAPFPPRRVDEFEVRIGVDLKQPVIVPLPRPRIPRLRRPDARP